MALLLVWCAELPAALELLVAILVLVAGGLTLRRFVYLRGPRAIRAVEWQANGGGSYVLWVGARGRRLAACVGDCRRYGPGLWILRFETLDGRFAALVDARCQDPRALRRLGRRLFGASDRVSSRTPPGAPPQGTATIWPKV